MAEHRPFHESVLGVMKGLTSLEVPLLAILIKTTRIPKGHDQIVEAWGEMTRRLFGEDWEEYALGVPEDLWEQKWEAETKEKTNLEAQAMRGCSGHQ